MRPMLSTVALLTLAGCQTQFLEPAATSAASNQRTLACTPYDLVDNPEAPGEIDFEDFLYLAEHFGETLADGTVLDFGFFLSFNDYFGTTCTPGPARAFASFDELLALRATTAEERIFGDATLDDDRLYELLDAMWDGQMPYGELGVLDAPIAYPDGTFEVPAGTMELVDAYADQYDETGSDYDLRYFEGLVTYGLFDPSVQEMMEAARKYLGDETLRADEPSLGDWLDAHRVRPDSCQVGCVVIHQQTEAPDLTEGEFDGGTANGFDFEVEITCEPAVAHPDLFSGLASCGSGEREWQYWGNWDTAPGAVTGEAEVTTTCNQATEVRMACLFVEGEEGDCDGAECPLTVTYGANAYAEAWAWRDTPMNEHGLPTQAAHAKAYSGFEDAAGDRNARTRFITLANAKAFASDDDDCEDGSGDWVEEAVRNNLNCQVGGSIGLNAGLLGFSPSLTCTYDITLPSGEREQERHQEQRTACDDSDKNAASLAFSDLTKYVPPLDGDEPSSVLPGDNTDDYGFEFDVVFAAGENSKDVVKKQLGSVLARAETEVNAVSHSIINQEGIVPASAETQVSGGSAEAIAGSSASLGLKGFPHAESTTPHLGSDGQLVSLSCGFATRHPELVDLIYGEEVDVGEWTEAPMSDDRWISVSCQNPYNEDGRIYHPTP